MSSSSPITSVPSDPNIPLQVQIPGGAPSLRGETPTAENRAPAATIPAGGENVRAVLKYRNKEGRYVCNDGNGEYNKYATACVLRARDYVWVHRGWPITRPQHTAI